MKINIGIIGYGNLGKAVEQIVLSRNDLNLVAIFSRRVVKSKYNSQIESYENIALYKNKIDVMLLCGGSFADLEKQTSDAILYFDCINTFDNHKKIYSELKRLDKLARNSGHRLIMSCGWDPGIFSIFRALFYSLSNIKPNAFWGKGISMGHSDAIRNLDGVIDAVEFTIPNETAIKRARKGKSLKDEANHYRECFVVAEKKYHKLLEKKIKNIPDYFKGQETSVEFVEKEKLLKLKENMSHKGEIISNFSMIDGSKCLFDFKLSTSSNPMLTATIMIRYVDALLNLKQVGQVGAFNLLDVPISFLFKQSSYDKIIKNLY